MQNNPPVALLADIVRCVGQPGFGECNTCARNMERFISRGVTYWWVSPDIHGRQCLNYLQWNVIIG